MIDETPSIVSVTVQSIVSVAFGSSSVTWPIRLIWLTLPGLMLLVIWIVTGTVFTTRDVPAETVLTPSDTETWMA